MKYSIDIQDAVNDPVKLEDLYQQSRKINDEAEFRASLLEVCEKSPDTPILGAWKARFDHQPMPKARRNLQWVLAVILGVISGLLLWSISDTTVLFLDKVPYIIILWAPIATIPVLIYLALISKRNYLYTAISCIGLIVVSVYVLLIAAGLSRFLQDYLILVICLLPLLCWIAIGIAVMGFRSSYTNRFAFMVKSIEVVIAAGVYLIFGMIFGGITLGMFGALNLTLPEILIRLMAAGGIGLVSMMAVATMYDPQSMPEAQDFNQGLSKFVATIVRLLLPLTFIVLFIYIFVIPFNFMAPFQNRDLLIVYNIMQFAIIGLLIGATPFRLEELSPKLQLWLRRGIIAVTILALVISLYALSAVVYRTVTGELTLNRLTIIGWNIINILILVAICITQLRKKAPAWQERVQKVFSRATTAYLGWSVFLILVLPLVFR